MNRFHSKAGGGLVLWIALTLVIILTIALLFVRKPEEKLEEPTERPVTVSVLTIEPRTMPDTIAIPGDVQGFVEATLAAEKPGRIVELNADKGDEVTAGQLLMRIDDRSWKAMLQQAEIEKREAEKDLERWKELEKAGAVSISDFDGIRTRNDMADVALEQARVNISQCEIRSPINGVVARRAVVEGEYVNEGMPVFVVVDIDHIKVAVDIPERDIGALSVGQELAFTVASLGGRRFAGTVTYVSSLANRESNSFPTELATDNPDRELRPGMIANVQLQRGVFENAVVVPLSAVIPRKGEHIVFVAEKGHAIRHTVKIEALVGHEAVLSAGVAPGDAVIVEGHRALVDGSLIEVAGE